MDIATISVARLALSFIPVAIVVVLMWRWNLSFGRSLHAVARMLLQLTLIGFVLVALTSRQRTRLQSVGLGHQWFRLGDKCFPGNTTCD